MSTREKYEVLETLPCCMRKNETKQVIVTRSDLSTVEEYDKAKASPPCKNRECVKRYYKMLAMIVYSNQHGANDDYAIDHCKRDSCHTLFWPGIGINCKKCKILWCNECVNTSGDVISKECIMIGILGEYDAVYSNIECFLCDKCK
jgi:hypothetical protein